MTLRPLPSRTNPKPFFFGEPRWAAARASLSRLELAQTLPGPANMLVAEENPPTFSSIVIRNNPRQPVPPCPACAAGLPTVVRVPVHVGDDLVVWMTPGRAATLRAEIAKLARELAEAEAAELGRS